MSTPVWHLMPTASHAICLQGLAQLQSVEDKKLLEQMGKSLEDSSYRN